MRACLLLIPIMGAGLLGPARSPACFGLYEVRFAVPGSIPHNARIEVSVLITGIGDRRPWRELKVKKRDRDVPGRWSALPNGHPPSPYDDFTAALGDGPNSIGNISPAVCEIGKRGTLIRYSHYS